MVRTQIQLTEDQSDRAREVANKLGISVAELIRRGLDEILSHETVDREVRESALSIIGIVRSETGDLSVNHDKYLLQAFSE